MNKQSIDTGKIDYSIFRAYDIRGLYPTEINEAACYAIGKAYCQVFKPQNIAIGMDVRLSSPPLKESLIQGILDAGSDVIDLGKITTDMLYFAVGAYGYSGGIVISASHNPKQYNGLKMVREKATAISSDTGLFTIRDVLKHGELKDTAGLKKGKLQKKEIVEDYVKHVLTYIGKTPIKPFRCVVNGNFGFVSLPVKRIARELKLDLIPLNFEPDGSFPKGPPNPLLPENQGETEELVKKSGADLGVMWDGDADRVMFVDNKGSFIPGVYITALLAKIMLEHYGQGNKIIFDPRAVWPIQKAVKEANGIGIITKAGHAFIKDRLRSENALFAGELSGHYYFRDSYYCDNGIIPWLLIMKYMSAHNTTLSEIVKPFTTGHHLVGELNYDVRDVKETMDEVIKQFKGMGAEDFTDGYSVETADWRFNIRPSNTEPIIRLNIEAKEEKTAEDIRQRIEKIIGKPEA
jgi:phosphomannomutase